LPAPRAVCKNSIHRFALAGFFRTRNDESDAFTMSKRKLLLLFFGCLAAVLLAGYWTLRLTAPWKGITIEKYEAIKVGMTEEEVEAILGTKGEVYPSSKRSGFYFATSGWRMSSDCVGKEWVGKKIAVCCRFDEAGRVAIKFRGFAPPIEKDSFLDKLRRWPGMQ
jgi:hypothetical protein